MFAFLKMVALASALVSVAPSYAEASGTINSRVLGLPSSRAFNPRIEMASSSKNFEPLLQPKVRGGAADDDSSTAGGISFPSNDVFLKIAVGLASAVTLPCSANPTFGANMFGVEAEEGGTTALFVEGIGNVVFSTALVGLLSNGSMSLFKAVGYGLIPRIIGPLRSAAIGRYPEHRQKIKVVSVMSAVYVGCIASLVSEGSVFTFVSPNTAIKFVAAVSAGSGIPMTIATPKYLVSMGIEVSEEEEEKATCMARFLGQNLVVSAVQLGCLARGIDPMLSFGYAALVSSGFFVYTVATKAVLKCGGKQRAPLSLMAVVLACGLRIFASSR